MGRPREFEPDEALDAIKEAFWRLGYDGASMHEIEAATGLRKQSLYREFGDKRAMYAAALDHYEQNEVARAVELLEEDGTARRRFARLFDELIRERDDRGCFMCNASIDQAPHDAAARARVSAMLKRWIASFETALAVSEPYRSSAKSRARKAAQLAATYMGLRVLIKAHAPEKTLRAAADETLGSI